MPAPQLSRRPYLQHLAEYDLRNEFLGVGRTREFVGVITSYSIHYTKLYEARTAKDQRVLQASIRGIEKKPMPHLLCVTNMLLHGVEAPSLIRHDNTLARPLRDWTRKDRVDVVLTNPPFGGIEEPGIEANFPTSFQTKETADLFLVLIMHLLKENGRAAVVLPDGFLFGDGIKARINRITSYNVCYTKLLRSIVLIREEGGRHVCRPGRLRQTRPPPRASSAIAD